MEEQNNGSILGAGSDNQLNDVQVLGTKFPYNKNLCDSPYEIASGSIEKMEDLYSIQPKTSVRDVKDKLGLRSGIKENYGWYYDNQRLNATTSVQLLANSFWNGDSWQRDKEYKYWIASSILTDDFSVNITNNWSDFGADMAADAVNQMKSFAPYAGIVKEALGTMMSRQSSTETKGELASGAKKAVSAGYKLMNTNNIVEILNRSLVTQGTRFTLYSGTNINFGGLGMRFTILPDFDGKRFVSVPKQLEKLYKYAIGPLEKFKWDGFTVKAGEEDGFIKGFKETINAMGDTAKDYVFWQMPPGGYQANVKDIDAKIDGTLQLQFGPYYRIDSLLISDMALNFSKQMVKNPCYTGVGDNDELISPLYCDVSISLRPATKYSDDSLKKFIGGDYTKRVSKSMRDILVAMDKERNKED